MKQDERPETDMERLRAAFAEFRRRGFWARISQDGGLQAVPEDLMLRSGKFIMWHEHETPFAFGPDGMLKRPLHLRHFKRHAEEIIAVLTAPSMFPDRAFIDHAALGGVVIRQFDLEPLDVEGEHDYNQRFMGRRFIIPTPAANEWYVAQATAAQIRLVADDVDGTWLTLPMARFTSQVINERIKEAAA